MSDRLHANTENHLTSQVVELVDHVNSVPFWLLDYLKKNDLPIDQAMIFHIRRLNVLLKEINNPPSVGLLAKVHPMKLTRKKPDEDLTEPLAHRFKRSHLRVWIHLVSSL